MRETKRIMPIFSFYDRTGIQTYLEKQANNGWMLEKMGGFTWKFRRIEPKKIHFAVVYFPKASGFDPGPSEEQQTFQEFCAHSGWKLAAFSGQLQIFYNEAASPVPIETDPEMELDNIHRTAKKSYLPSYLLLIVSALMQLFVFGMNWNNDPLQVLSNYSYFFNGLCSTILLLICVAELIGYFTWHAKAKRAAAEGEFIPTRGTKRLQTVLLSFDIVALVLMLFAQGNPEMSLVMLASLALVCGVIAITLGATWLMKRLNFSAKMNYTVTIVLCIVLTVVAMGFGIAGIVSSMNDRWDEEDADLPTYEFHGETWVLYRDEMSLKVQDLRSADPEIYSYVSNIDESWLLRVEKARQRPRYDMMDQPAIWYTIVEVKAGFLYDFCLNRFLNAEKDSWSEDIYGNITYDEYRQVDATPWGANAVYQEFNGAEPMDKYLLCYDGFIVEFQPDWELNSEQMAKLGSLIR